jgi:hypothetical protein
MPVPAAWRDSLASARVRCRTRPDHARAARSLARGPPDGLAGTPRGRAGRTSMPASRLGRDTRRGDILDPLLRAARTLEEKESRGRRPFGEPHMGADLLRVPRRGDSQRSGMWRVVPTSTVAGVEPALRCAGAVRRRCWRRWRRWRPGGLGCWARPSGCVSRSSACPRSCSGQRRGWCGCGSRGRRWKRRWPHRLRRCRARTPRVGTPGGVGRDGDVAGVPGDHRLVRHDPSAATSSWPLAPPCAHTRQLRSRHARIVTSF